MERNAEKAKHLNDLSGSILDSAIEVHRTLGGPGLLEAVYEESLAYELQLRGFTVARQVQVPTTYKGHQIKRSLVIDLIIDKQIIIEVKSVEKNNPVFSAQLLTYLRLTDKPLGLLINFGEKFIKNGFQRVVNRFPDL